MSGCNEQWSHLSDEAKKLLDRLDADVFPILVGESEAIRNYYSLERLERTVGSTTLKEHRQESTLWYRGIELFYRSLVGEWPLSAPAFDELTGKSAPAAQLWILSLEVSGMKSSLDQLVRGTYSSAFAAIRHMLESYIQVKYLALHPESSEAWIFSGTRTPGFSKMLTLVLHDPDQLPADEFRTEVFQRIKKAWNLLSGGSHPTFLGLVQVRPRIDEEMTFLGSIYRAELALIGFDLGLFAINLLLGASNLMGRTDEKWRRDVDDWAREVGRWRFRLRNDPRALHLDNTRSMEED